MPNCYHLRETSEPGTEGKDVPKRMNDLKNTHVVGENIRVTAWWQAALLLPSPAPDTQEEDCHDEGRDQQKLGEPEGVDDAKGNAGVITVTGGG